MPTCISVLWLHTDVVSYWSDQHPQRERIPHQQQQQQSYLALVAVVHTCVILVFHELKSIVDLQSCVVSPHIAHSTHTREERTYGKHRTRKKGFESYRVWYSISIVHQPACATHCRSESTACSCVINTYDVVALHLFPYPSKP